MNKLYQLENYIDEMRKTIEFQSNEIQSILSQINSIAENSSMSDDDYVHICDLISIIYARLSILENL